VWATCLPASRTSLSIYTVLLQKLYVRIWLAVVLAVAVLTLLVGWVWRMTAEPPLREVVVRNAIGEIIGNGQARRMRHPDNMPVPNAGAELRSGNEAGATASAGAATDTSGNAPPDPRLQLGEGPQFMVRMQDGKTMHLHLHLHLHLPRPPQGMPRAPFGFFWMLGLVAVAVAVATYPIVRRLTRRLEALQNGVERWGDGDLSARVAVTGGDEVGFLAMRFNHAAQQIETLVNARDALLASQKSLLANASHELRSPLTRIRMGLEMLGGSPSSAAKTEIVRNISELDQLILNPAVTPSP
jgi:HAMP domain-containing protein